MCRFAKDILLKMRHLTVALQRRLGPETEELALRVGLHSGPVTAGVLRGQNSRFQLFGDTMNTGKTKHNLNSVF
jgi:class 3 adenylate cyclase